MAKNRMINTKFWSDGWILNLDPLERYLFLYFLTNEHTNICGVYELPIRIIARESGIDDNMVEKMIKKMSDKISYYNGWIYIKNFIKHQKSSGNVKLGIENGLKEVPKDILAKLSKDLDTPPSVLNTAQYLNPNPNLNPNMKEEDFNSFWKVYPNHKNKKKALDKFLKLKRSLLTVILKAVVIQSKGEQWQKNSGAFIPHPTTWLNGERWEDEAEPIKKERIL